MAKKKVVISDSKALIPHPNPDEVSRIQCSLYQKTLDAQAKLSEQYHYFIDYDKLKYDNWIQSTFDSLLLKCFDKHRELHDLKTELDEIYFYSETTGKSHKASARILARERAKGEKSFIEFLNKVDEDQLSNGSELDDSSSDQDGSEESDFSENSSTSKSNDDHYKRIYHECVRLIHPDVVPEDSFDNDLWNELQHAHKDQDFHKLEDLKKRIATKTTNPEPTRAGDIVNLRLHVEKKIKDLKKEIARSRKDPAWSFAKKSTDKKHMKKLFRQVEEEINDDLSLLTSAVIDARRFLQQFAPKARKSRQ